MTENLTSARNAAGTESAVLASVTTGPASGSDGRISTGSAALTDQRLPNGRSFDALEMQMSAFRNAGTIVRHLRNGLAPTQEGHSHAERVRVADFQWRHSSSALVLLPGAATYYLHPTVAGLIAMASASYPLEQAVLRSEDLYQQSGWFWCDDPPLTVIIKGARYPLHGILWGFGPSSIDKTEPRMTLVAQGYSLGPRGYPGLVIGLTRNMGIALTDSALQMGMDQDGVDDESRALLRFLFTAQQWLSQGLLVTHGDRPPRALRRRWEREMSSEAHPIGIVRLRTREYPDGGTDESPRAVNWSCQWLVSGYWRNQFRRDRGTRVPTWVSPHLKGPSDKPLKAPHR